MNLQFPRPTGRGRFLASFPTGDTRSRAGRNDSSSRHVGALPAALTIRAAGTLDQPALHRLASLDSAEVPSGPLLVAEIDQDVRAALSLGDGSVIANPFFSTEHLVQALRAHARSVAA